MRWTVEAKRALAAGAKLAAAVTLSLGKIDKDIPWVTTGDGSANYSVPLQHYQAFSDATGVQTLDVGSLTGPSNEALDFAGVRLVAIHNRATDAAHVLVARPAAVAGFKGDLGTDGGTEDPELTIQPGTVGIFACKPLGPPHDTTANTSIELDFGANTFDADVVILGNAAAA